MKNKILAVILAFTMVMPVFADTIGSVNYREVIDNYSKAKTAQNEIEDKANSIQIFLLDKEKEFKTMQSPVQQKAFREKTAKSLEQQEKALRGKKEKEIDDAIVAAIKAVAIENKIDAVVDARVMFFGAVDITQKVITKLNMGEK